MNADTRWSTFAGVPVPVSGHEPQIIAFCTCGWESPVYVKGGAAEAKWLLHIEEHRP